MRAAALTHAPQGTAVRAGVPKPRAAQPAAFLRPQPSGKSAAAAAASLQQRHQRRRQRGARLAVQANTTNYGAEWATPKDAFLTVGLAHCYVKNEDGKLVDQYVIEPITANAMECMANGAKTSFMHVFSLKLGEAQARDKSAFPPEFAQGVFCDDYEGRCDACARTWMRPHALDNLLDIVPLGQLKSSFNYSTADKRVLNMENEVTDDDNVKQDLSIDVYGRKAKEEAAAKIASDKAAPAEAKKEEEEDDMDALLSV